MKNITLIRRAALAGLIVVSTASLASASITVVGTTSGASTAPPSLSTTYPVLNAVNFGGSAFNYQGVNFTGESVTGSGTVTEESTPFTMTITGNSNGGIGQATVGAGTYAPLFETGLWTLDFSATLTISGLNPAYHYEFQFLNGDTRGGDPYNTATQSFTDNLSDTATTPLTFNTTGTNQYVDTVVDATGITSFSYTMPQAGGATHSPSFAGVVVSGAVPEPSAWLSMVGGVGMLVGFRRRRRE